MGCNTLSLRADDTFTGIIAVGTVVYLYRRRREAEARCTGLKQLVRRIFQELVRLSRTKWSNGAIAKAPTSISGPTGTVLPWIFALDRQGTHRTDFLPNYCGVNAVAGVDWTVHAPCPVSHFLAASFSHR